MKKAEDDRAEVIKVLCQLEGFTYRKATGEWIMSFVIQKPQLKHAQPLQNEMESNFVIACVKVKSLEEVETIMRKEN